MIPIRTRSFLPSSIAILSFLTFSTPFLHLHPQVTHADQSGEHTHAAAIHTIFSLAHSGGAHPAQNAINTETPMEFTGVKIAWPLAHQRLTSHDPADAPAFAATSSLASPLPASAPPARLLVGSVAPPASWIGHHSSPRAPPARLNS